MAAPNQFGFKGQKQFKQPGHTIEMCQVPHKNTSLPANYLGKKKKKTGEGCHMGAAIQAIKKTEKWSQLQISFSLT